MCASLQMTALFKIFVVKIYDNNTQEDRERPYVLY